MSEKNYDDASRQRTPDVPGATGSPRSPHREGSELQQLTEKPCLGCGTETYWDDDPAPVVCDICDEMVARIQAARSAKAEQP